ncbi:uncharacterized protein LOC108876568 [Lates japonicus]|uniref:Immunoglobulin subtype domain-containing protein n=1 Tax=Lates japonicus TaxID=270547 RepID=A0AAD3M2Q5_LATJO|nr:uncharacterized protein AKAME5_000041900 [Lates japonicus]
MKFSFVFFLLLDIPHLNGQQKIEEFEHILLRLAFPSFYNSHSKSCCKLYPGGCYKLLDSTGYTCELLRGRVTKTENDGWIEFKISNVQFVDRGYYRCIVLGTQNHIYSDYYVEISEASVHHSHSQPPLTTTTKPLNTSTTLPDSTEPALAQDHRNSPSVPWSFSLPLAVIVSITVMILITSVIGVVCFRVRTKRKQPDKSVETLCESLKQEGPEMSSIVYTTVDFRAHQRPKEVYANLRMPTTRAGAPDTEDAEMVEYSTLAIHQ